MHRFVEQLGLTIPLIQAPMAGISTPELAAAVSNAGALGSISVGAINAARAREMIAELRARTVRPFNINVFAHVQPNADAIREANWLSALAPYFRSFGAAPPAALQVIYRTFLDDDDMLALLLETAPAVVSFHFGIPPAERIRALKSKGILLLASATNLREAQAIEVAGLDAIVAQGYEAGGHRGIFHPEERDDCLTTSVLTRLLAQKCKLPIIAAGGIMDGQGIAAALDLGAAAVQMGTAFIACPESSAAPAFRDLLKSEAALHTTMTTAISGRPARCIVNRFTALGEELAALPRPDYPIAYDAGKALHVAASAKGESGFAAHLAGQGAALSRGLPAAELVAVLAEELRAARN